ncbi:unnamed protein product [Psylliodes chrysocephalus]|uniref:CCHC-type domain-containing protein n=1 Tax=Psylliodes chrysocephalus TaxID=3402493 RepID=A0A9P0G6K9_9CUCU|nr:unnamed protein product [Psylliodes chrysocephala]
MEHETADYSSSQTALQINVTQNIVKTYSSVVTQQFPSKEQSIIFNSIKNAFLQDYLIPLGSLIQPKNILFSSRMSNQRICMYLANKSVVNIFMTNYGQIKINGQTVTARRLITPAERLVLSNVCPTISHDLILQELQNIGLSFLSAMVFLKINSTSPEFSHILSFRRQIYVNPPNFNVPESIIINHENTSYRLILSLDNLTCFNCKKAGHKASNCSEQTFSNTPTYSQPLANQNPILNQIAPQEDNDQITLRQNEPTTSQILAPDNEKLNSNLRTNVTSNKRSASAILTPTPHPSDAIPDNLFAKPQNVTVPEKLKAMTPNSQML